MSEDLGAMDLPSLFADRCDLARIYAIDGAPRRAACILREVADELEARAARRDAAFDAMPVGDA